MIKPSGEDINCPNDQSNVLFSLDFMHLSCTCWECITERRWCFLSIQYIFVEYYGESISLVPSSIPNFVKQIIKLLFMLMSLLCNLFYILTITALNHH
jgi:hypothetical protein